MNVIKLKVREERFPIAGTFTISRGSRTEARVVTVELDCGGISGHGECVPYARYGETVEGVIAEIESLATELEAGLDREALQSLLPPGAARNALDCAFWDLEAKQSGKRIWQILGIDEPMRVQTAFTLSLESPEKMAKQAAENAERPLLKVKLGTNDDLARIAAVRGAAPNPVIIVDANEGWNKAQYERLAPELSKLGVAMVEQPFPAGDDEALRELDRVLPVCADESCHDRASLPDLQKKYDLINIKLDKTGGLTEAIALQKDAIEAGFGIMVGCMVGTSLAMAPAMLLSHVAQFVDLDGPLLLSKDRETPLPFSGSVIEHIPRDLWG